MKKKIEIMLSTLLIVASVSVCVHAADLSQNIPQIDTIEYNLFYDNEITDVLPGYERVTCSKVTKTLPKNVDGNQGISVFSSTITESDLEGSFTAKVTKFTNSMTSVNMAIYVGTECIGSSMDMDSWENLSFDIPANVKGKTFKIVMSTNSSKTGTCTLKVSKI